MDGFTPARSAAAAGTARPCEDEVCITCSDTAVPSRVVELRQPHLALVDTGSSLEEVSVALVDARPGDTVLVHAGEAIAVVAEM
jgi:hydrogenase expression/formation protein HypC